MRIHVRVQLLSRFARCVMQTLSTKALSATPLVVSVVAYAITRLVVCL